MSVRSDRPVRSATPADLDALADLWSAITAHHASFDPLFSERDDARPEVCRLLLAQLRDPQTKIQVWDEGSGPLGMAIVRIDRAPPILEEVLRAEITDLGVRPEARRRGIGRALVDAALAWVRERGVLRVEARVVGGNPEGQAFWRALGFGDFMDILHRRL